MWLLSTHRAELQWFDSPSSTDIHGGYAILSHTWGAHEQTYRDVNAIIESCRATGDNPRDSVSDKIRNCCEQAEQHGYAWVWIDTCCINKESSTELAESINSMFIYYARSECCYVYLEDVPGGDAIELQGSAFRRARWHTRAWTLQELIASSVVIFMANDWTQLGTKDGMANLLRSISGIPTPYLISPRLIHSSSVAMRMSWAADRKATRAEDAAYCLLGIFDVTMPIIYGEGKRAFQRLQMEILNKSWDTTIFTWMPGYQDNNIGNLRLATIDELRRVWHGSLGQDNNCLLLAQKPEDFIGLRGHTFTPSLSGQNAIQPYMKHQWEDLVSGCQSSIENTLKPHLTETSCTGASRTIRHRSREVEKWAFRSRRASILQDVSSRHGMPCAHRGGGRSNNRRPIGADVAVSYGPFASPRGRQ